MASTDKVAFLIAPEGTERVELEDPWNAVEDAGYEPVLLSTEDGEAQGLRVIVESATDLATIRRERAKGLRIACNGNASADRLAEILQPFRNGRTPVTIRYWNDRVDGEVELPEAWRVTPDDALIDQLREWLAPENVQVVY